MARVQAGKLAQLPPDVVLSAGAKVRLMEYNSYLVKVAGEYAAKDQCGVVDLSQNARVRPTLKSEFPSLLCQSQMWSQHHERCLLSVESLLLMGWPISCLTPKCSCACPWTDEYLMSVKPAQLFKMTGNAMPCRLTGLFLATCLSVTRYSRADDVL